MSNRTAYYGGSPGPPRSDSRFSRNSSHHAHQPFVPHGPGGLLYNGPGDGYELHPQEMSAPDPLYYPQPGENVIPSNFASAYPYAAPMEPFYYGSPTYYYPQNTNLGNNFLNTAHGPYNYPSPTGQVNDYTEWSTSDYSAQMEKIAISDPNNDETNTGQDARSSSNESVGKSRRFSRQRNIRENSESNRYQSGSSNKHQSQNQASKHEIRFSHQRKSKNADEKIAKMVDNDTDEKNGDRKQDNSSRDDARFSIIRSLGKREIDTGYKQVEISETNVKPTKSVQKSKQQRTNKFAKSESSDSQSGVLLEQLTNGTYECMVCCDRVKQQHAIWNCSKCHHVFHMGCIKKWARSPAAMVEGEGWRCPACQNLSKKYPNTYFCFCGKVKEPEWNRRETPHSCGEVCGKKRSNNDTCTHPCNILCHPGPCPPCPASVIKNCLCGKMTRKIRCSQQKPLTCSEPCGKTKNCGVHKCDAVCHDGDCSQCDILVAQACFCGQSGRNITCGSAEADCELLPGNKGVYSCGKKCGKALDCGNHQCSLTCHSGECAPCPLMPSAITTCPCTQTKLSDILDSEGERYQRYLCTDPIPVCDKICGKPLKCGGEDIHTCQLRCHQGDCRPCEDRESAVKCRCGKSEKDVPCSEIPEEPYICDRRCNKKRKCGRHKCGKTCCTDSEHVCNQPCGRKLECKLHRCEETCHRGNCHACYNVSFDELACHCGAEIIFPPIPCGTKPPECTNICIRQHPCFHPVNHNCHNEEKCPPCVVLVQKKCNCGRVIRKNIPCHQENVSCGAPCKKPLPCGHSCSKPCHQGPCMDEEDVCNQPCSIMRVECIHPCANPCHHGKPCPPTPCKAIVTLKCNCGNLEKQVECSAGGATYQRLSSEAFARQQQLSTSHSVDISNLFQGAGKQKILPCNEECSAKERNRRLAEALNIDDKDSLQDFTQYSSFLQGWVRKDVLFVRGIEQELTSLVEAVEWLDKNKRNHTFPSMKRDKRQVVHELAEVFNCKSLSCDEEPNRSVVVTAVRGISKVPRVLPSESVKKSPDSTSYSKIFTTTSPLEKTSEGSKRLLSSMKLVSMTSSSPAEGRNKSTDIDLATKRPVTIPRMPTYPSNSKATSSSSSSLKSYKSRMTDYPSWQEHKSESGSSQGGLSRPSQAKMDFTPFQHEPHSRALPRTTAEKKSKSAEPDIDYFDMTG